jgi:hypothetical protein
VTKRAGSGAGILSLRYRSEDRIRKRIRTKMSRIQDTTISVYETYLSEFARTAERDDWDLENY